MASHSHASQISSPRHKRLRLEIGGDDGVRTHDPLLAGQVLSQLSYTPVSGSLSLFQRSLKLSLADP